MLVQGYRIICIALLGASLFVVPAYAQKHSEFKECIKPKKYSKKHRFYHLINYFQKTQFYKSEQARATLTKMGNKKIEEWTLSVFPEKNLKTRYQQYLPKFCKFIIKKQELLTFKKKNDVGLKNTDVTEAAKRLKYKKSIEKASELLAKLDQALFYVSAEARLSFQEVLSLITDENKKKYLVNRLKKKRPKMPGIFGGSTGERRFQEEEQKPFLTPVDSEFYRTQLGQKIEKDLGAEANFWSYDYENNELYVLKKGQKSPLKLKVKSNYIQSRNGEGYFNPVGSDEKIDFNRNDPILRGKFLSKNKDSESLFGEYQKKKGPATVIESGSGHFPGDGHDHDHDHDHD